MNMLLSYSKVPGRIYRKIDSVSFEATGTYSICDNFLTVRIKKEAVRAVTNVVR